MRSIRYFINHIRYGEWCCGCEFWEGKPMLYAGRHYYDGWHYILHVGPFYISHHY